MVRVWIIRESRVSKPETVQYLLHDLADELQCIAKVLVVPGKRHRFNSSVICVDLLCNVN